MSKEEDKKPTKSKVSKEVQEFIDYLSMVKEKDSKLTELYLDEYLYADILRQLKKEYENFLQREENKDKRDSFMFEGIEIKRLGRI